MYNIILLLALMFLIFVYIFNTNLDKITEKIILILIILSLYMDLNNRYKIKENLTVKSNEAIQDIANIYNTSGTLTVPKSDKRC